MLSNNNSSVKSNTYKKDCEKNQLYFDDDIVAMSNDYCTITTSSSNLSYDSAGNAYNEIERGRIN